MTEREDRIAAHMADDRVQRIAALVSAYGSILHRIAHVHGFTSEQSAQRDYLWTYLEGNADLETLTPDDAERLLDRAADVAVASMGLTNVPGARERVQ